MRKILNIIFLMAIWFLLTAKSCDHAERSNRAHEEKLTETSKDSIISAFSPDRLSRRALRDFEESARLKLYELGDYLNILADSGTPDGFKIKVVALSGSVLFSNKVRFDLTTRHCPNGDNQLFHYFQKSGFSNIIVPAGIDFDSVFILKPFEPVNDSLYAGQLGFNAGCMPPYYNERARRLWEKKVIDLFILKRIKVFGADTIKVWTLLFGDAG